MDEKAQEAALQRGASIGRPPVGSMTAHLGQYLRTRKIYQRVLFGHLYCAEFEYYSDCDKISG